jgi:3',5'-cyclic AMP phosphodiesterase CpdA
MGDIVTWILHLSDPHLGVVSPGQELDDSKLDVAREDIETTQTVFRQTLASLRPYIVKHGKPSAVVASGDLTYRATSQGFQAFGELLGEYSDVLPDDPRRILVVPGNHDVDWSTPAGTEERYDGFLAATRGKGCATPLLDGVDFNNTGKLALRPGVGTEPHVVEDPEFLILPLNSSNYCGTVPKVRGAWSETEWEKRLAPLAGDPDVLRQLETLRKHDIARISRRQVRALRLLLEELGISVDRGDDPRPRLAVLHHQLLPVSTQEEWKTFETMVNLGFVRETLLEFGADVVLHGHKHQGKLYWDYARRGSEPVTAPVRRVLVIASPGHFRANAPVMRALELAGPTRARNLRVKTFSGVEAYAAQSQVGPDLILPLWLGQMESESSEQIVIRARGAHEAYSRVCAHFEQIGTSRLENIVCEVDTPSDATVVPPGYPEVGRDDEQQWFTDLVDWWQRPDSKLVRERVLPFNHGERIRERWGDQIERAVRLLNEREGSSRGMAILIAPDETGRREGDTQPLKRGTLPAFTLVEFGLTRRGRQRELDCFAYFRKQEMRYWWPVNLAELALLQDEVRAGLKAEYQAGNGRLVTFSAIAEYGTELPRVAVTEIDRAIEDDDRIWRLAAAIAFPIDNDGTPSAAEDWRRILAELDGQGRQFPPVPALGDETLLAEVKRFAGLAGKGTPAAVVARRLEALCAIYRTMRGKEIRQAEADLIRPAVRKLAKAVSTALEAASN